MVVGPLREAISMAAVLGSAGWVEQPASTSRTAARSKANTFFILSSPYFEVAVQIELYYNYRKDVVAFATEKGQVWTDG